MAIIRGGKKLERVLSTLSQNVKNGGVLRCGFLERSTYPDGTSVAFVAAMNEFGHRGPDGKPVGPWPFFRGMIQDKKGEWGPALAKLLKASNYDGKSSLDKLGEGIAGQLRQSITATYTPALKPSTIRRKGSSKPMVDTGHMLNSVDHEVTG
jgi:hypothetical protein